LEILLVQLLREQTAMVQGACQVAPVALRPVQPRFAPFWHTRALILMLLAVAVTGSLLDTQSALITPTSRLAGSYLPLLLTNLGLAFYVARFGLAGSMFGPLVGRAETRRLVSELSWGALLMLLVLGVESALQSWLGMPESLFAHATLPHLPAEKASWTLLAILIGCSEELVYRGYLLRQLQALSGSAWLALLLQASLFGVAHGAQGQWAVARFAAYGLAFGYVAQRQRSIVPCVVCHVGLDVCAGLVGC
jgi:membrane protease YdiL (CAAX protease family)